MSVWEYTRKPKPHEICTKETPWNEKEGRDRMVHPDSVDDGYACEEGCCVWMKCPHCGLRFKEDYQDEP